MRAQGSGVIVQVTSMGGRMPFAGVGAYSAGAFRTGLHRNGRRQEAAVIPAYDGIVGPVRAQQAGFDGAQPGDPVKAAAAIIAAVGADDPPLRLLLGNDAVDAVTASAQAAQAELTAWEEVSRGTDIAWPPH
jgi:hypothetical protein